MTTHEPPPNRRFYTLEEANRMLPLVRVIVGDLMENFKEYESVKALIRQRKHTPDDRTRLKMQCGFLEDRLEEAFIELQQMDISFKNWDGKIDFPAWHDGREIEFCWKFGEEKVTHWHELYAGYANRKKVTIGMQHGCCVEEATKSRAKLVKAK